MKSTADFRSREPLFDRFVPSWRSEHRPHTGTRLSICHRRTQRPPCTPKPVPGLAGSMDVGLRIVRVGADERDGRGRGRRAPGVEARHPRECRHSPATRSPSGRQHPAGSRPEPRASPFPGVHAEGDPRRWGLVRGRSSVSLQCRDEGCRGAAALLFTAGMGRCRWEGVGVTCTAPR